MDGTSMYNCPTFFLFWKCLDDMSYWTNLYRTVADNQLHFFTISNLNYTVFVSLAHMMDRKYSRKVGVIWTWESLARCRIWCLKWWKPKTLRSCLSTLVCSTGANSHRRPNKENRSTYLTEKVWPVMVVEWTHWNTVRYYEVSNCGISKFLQAIVHDGCPSQLAGKKLRGD